MFLCSTHFFNGYGKQGRSQDRGGRIRPYACTNEIRIPWRRRYNSYLNVGLATREGSKRHQQLTATRHPVSCMSLIVRIGASKQCKAMACGIVKNKCLLAHQYEDVFTVNMHFYILA